MNARTFHFVLRCAPAILPVLVAGCGTVARQTSDLEVPASWKQDGARGVATLDTAALTRWWSRFQDPVLDRLITEALQGSTNVRTAFARVEESRARRGVAGAALFPQVTGGLSAQAASSRDRVADVTTTRDTYTPALNMSWEVDVTGRLSQNLKAAMSDLDQAQDNYYAAQVSLAAEVADAYVSLRVAETQLSVYQRNVAAREGTAQITRWREQAGQGSALETQQAASTLEQARAAVPNIKQNIEQGRNRLALLSGRAPGSLDSLLTRARAVPAPPSVPAAGIPAEMLAQRPDVRAARHAFEAAVTRTKSAERQQYPTLTLTGSLSLQSLGTGALFSPQTAAADALGQLAAPIFNAGRIRQNIHIQSALEKQALIAWEASVLDSLSEVENAFIAINRTRQRLATLDLAVAAAREAEKLASQSYEAGQIDLLQVLDAQRTLLTLEEQDAIARGNTASAHIQLYKALGGGWSR